MFTKLYSFSKVLSSNKDTFQRQKDKKSFAHINVSLLYYKETCRKYLSLVKSLLLQTIDWYQQSSKKVVMDKFSASHHQTTVKFSSYIAKFKCIHIAMKDEKERLEKLESK